jgi:hypothetical protein
MKNMKKILILIALFSGFVASSFAQATATADVAASILAPITLTKKVDMAFGNIAINNTTGTVSLPAHTGGITPADRFFTGGITFPAVTGTVSDAEFDVTGEVGTTYAIILPVSCTISSGSYSMNIDTYLTDIGLIGTLNGTTGAQSFYVGSTLHVGASQNPGTYTGSFPVTVNYN